ncbi:MAG: DUF1284 domain-containing protein [Hespellia sp.]|nr:DUF1284 domain-containing protein [Hespellia sp.]
MSRQPDPLKLRAHHLLCTGLFVGEGYSDAFSMNMSEVVHRLKDPDTTVTLLCQTDAICGVCPKAPKADSEGTSSPLRKCRHDRCNLSSVASKDERLLDALGLKQDCIYSFSDVLTAIRLRLTKDIFLDCCSDCSWYLKGLCDYTVYQKNISKHN